jgi:hypothetical protein
MSDFAAAYFRGVRRGGSRRLKRELSAFFFPKGLIFFL